MALGARRTFLVLLVTFCALGCGWTVEKPVRPRHGKQMVSRESWEPPIHLDGKPVDRVLVSSHKPSRSHRFNKVKDSRTHLMEDLDRDWVNLDGFAVLGNRPVSNSSAGSVRSTLYAARSHSTTAGRTTRGDKMAQSAGVTYSRMSRRAPPSSSGPKQSERRRQHAAKPQADQRRRHTPKLTSESVHVVSLQAQDAQGQSTPNNKAVPAKASIPEEYEVRDLSVRVMSPKSVLISWVDPAVEMGKVSPGTSRSYTIRFREKGESARWEYKDSTQRRVMIDTLFADSMYEFSVRISERENHGKWGISVFQRTPESAPSGPPENFEVKPLRGKGTAVIATWDPPEEPNGRIREYILSYASAMKPFGMKSTTCRGSITTATIDGLTPGERYIFKIRATNRRGMGPQSKVFSVVMPESKSTASTSSKSKGSQKINDFLPKTDIEQNESNLQPSELPNEPTTTSKPRLVAPVNKRVRPLSQTRSYHSIFSSVRSSVRNVANSESTKDVVKIDKEETDDTTTIPPTTKETTTMRVVLQTKEPDNNVPPAPEVVLETDSQTTKTPNLKISTPSPVKPAHVRPNRRPVKIRVHKKAESKTSSSDSSDSNLSSPSSSSPADSSLPSSQQNQESAASREDYTASTYTETKDIFKKPSTTQDETNSRQSGATPRTAGSSSSGRSPSSESGFSSRYGYRQRNSGTLSRGNATRTLSGQSAAHTQLNLPSRSRSRASSNTQSSLKLPSSATESKTDPDTSYTFNPEKSGSSSGSVPPSSTLNIFDKSQSTVESSSRGSTALRGNNLSNGQNGAIHHSTASTSRFSSHEKNEKDNERENVQGANTRVSNPTEGKAEERVDESSSEKTPGSRKRVGQSIAERFPWLASRYPGRFGSNTRTTSSRQDGRTPWTRVSSSVGADRPVLRGMPTRVSGAVGAAGVSLKQETTEDLGTSSVHDTLKNGIVSGSFKPSLTDQNTGGTVSLVSSTSSNEPIHKESSRANSNDYKDYSGERSGENTASQRNPLVNSGKHANTEDNESVGTRETFSRIRPSTSTGVNLSHRNPGLGTNTRGRSPYFTNRQFSGSRLPFRPQPAQNSRLGASRTDSSSQSSISNLPKSVLTSDFVGSGTTVTKTGGLVGEDSQSTSSSGDTLRNHGIRPRFPIRGKPFNEGFKPGNGNGKTGRPNLSAAVEKEFASSDGVNKGTVQRFITGPDGTKWVVDMERGVLMNQEGQVLQDSQGKPKRVVLGEDGRTIFDHMGSPLVSQEGIALFGHGRDSQPVVNPKDKVLMVGGRPVLGLDVVPPKTTTTTTTQKPTTTEWMTESTSMLPYPTCPPGTFSKIDEYGYPVLDPEGILDCYPEEDSSGMEMDHMFTVSMMPDALALEKEEIIIQTTVPPSTAPTITMATPAPEQHINAFNEGPVNEFDLSGKKRFTAPYVNYIQKDPGAPCSLTEALEYLQVDVLQNLLEKDSPAANQKQPPKNKPHNLTVVAMEGCHSFIILDWARPLKDDMVSGYMVHSASYDDVLNNRWSARASNGTHLPVENLKPNSRYYFKVQAKNVFGLGPFSETLTYVTESDDPLLIERPPGGEPIWIPFTFKYNPSHSSCKGSQYVKRTWYRKFVGVVLCNSLRYKIFMGDGLREPFYSVGDRDGQGEDHCQFVDSYRDGRTGPSYMSNNLPSAQGYYRAYRQEPVTFGVIGRRTPYPFVGWYECGVPIPGKW